MGKIKTIFQNGALLLFSVLFSWALVETLSYSIIYFHGKNLSTQNSELPVRHQRLLSEKHPMFEVKPEVPFANFWRNQIEKERLFRRGTYIQSPYLNYRFAPLKTYSRTELKINKFGFIHNSDDPETPAFYEKKYLVVLLGGSSMAGARASLNSKTIAAQLEKMLGNARVINAGVGGYSSTKELVYFLTELIHYKPTVVVALDGWNDFWNHYPHSDFGIKYDNWVLPNRAIQEQKVSDAITRAEIIEWNVYRQMLSTPSRFKDVFYFTTEMALLLADYSERKNGEVYEPEWGTNPWLLGARHIRKSIYKTDSYIPYLRANWLSLIGSARANGIKVVTLLQPARPMTKKSFTKKENDGYRSFVKDDPTRQDYEKSVIKFYNGASEVTRELSSKFSSDSGVYIADASQIFEKETEDIFIDYVHYTDLGNQKIATYLAGIIKPWLAK